MLFLFGFFISTSAFLVTYFGNRSDWKYRKQRLITFRDFTGKIHSTSTVMGILSILFMLAITFGGIGTTVGLMAARNVEASAFDVLILHPGEQYDFSRYETIIQKSFPLQSHTYEIYTGGKTDFLSVHDQTIVEAGRSVHRTYAEFEYDTYMAYHGKCTMRTCIVW